mgnify:CR=1 FL=1
MKNFILKLNFLKNNLLIKLISNSKKLKSKFELFKNSNLFGFIQGHDYIPKEKVKIIKSFLKKNDNSIIKKFETKFASLIGDGECFSYASSRMGFYEILNFLKISSEDEIILVGFTCAVMANAIIKKGAKIKYCDIDINNLGTCSTSIKKLINDKTRVIVAQHSFGIPCEIQEISSIAKKYGIFLIEDCALSLSSKFEGTTLGNFGNAAIFSTDHSKPINTITGGLVYTQNSALKNYLKKISKSYPELSTKNKEYLWQLFIFERNFCNLKNFGKTQLLSLIYRKFFRSLRQDNNELFDDISSKPKQRKTYPAKMPTFCALIGLIEIDRWTETSKKRVSYLNKFLRLATSKNLKLPNCYFDNRLKIVPLRLIFFIDISKNNAKKYSKFLDVKSIWFKKPIIGTNEPLINFYYKYGSCQKAEELGRSIINLPCCTNENDFIKMLKYLASS